LNENSYRRLIADKGGGFVWRLVRLLLLVLSVFYWAAVALRNSLYERGLLKVRRVNATVISIGNITAGGTGKTPLVIWLANLLCERDFCCAILTRGYKTRKGTFKDEPAILAKSCPKARIVINPDRFAGAARAVNEFGAGVLIMDDGFQHRRLARQLDIVAIDSTCPFGYNRLLPAGLLREPVEALKRADAVVITRSNQTPKARLEQLERKVRMINPAITIAKCVHKPVCAKTLEGRALSLDELGEKKIYAFCGIGNPDAFFDGLKKLGLNVIGSKTYNDHHQYTDTDIADIFEEARYLTSELVVTTQKDWVKTALPTLKQDLALAYLAVRLDFIEGEDKIVELVEKVLATRINTN